MGYPEDAGLGIECQGQDKKWYFLVITPDSKTKRLSDVGSIDFYDSVDDAKADPFIGTEEEANEELTMRKIHYCLAHKSDNNKTAKFEKHELEKQ